MNMSQVLILFYTLRYLKIKQIVYQLYYRIKNINIPSPSQVKKRQWLKKWSEPAVKPVLMLSENEFIFLGEHGSFSDNNSWRISGKSKLWLYNLHYLDDLTAFKSDERVDLHIKLIERWVQGNPPIEGPGWEPYPISIRLVNIIKWWSRNPNVLNNSQKEMLLQSIELQAQVLYERIEYHILGNHLFANAKALIFVGAFLQDCGASKYLAKGLMILDNEITEQFLDDGAHFELSPMYHSVMLWDLCDLINLFHCTNLPELSERVSQWCEQLKKGAKWLSSMLHPDGKIAFFNDSAFDYAPEYNSILTYANSVISENKFNFTNHSSPQSVIWNKASGYCRIEKSSGNIAILDLAKIGADYQPGHAHADTLSFELSINGQRVLVNSGTSKYGDDNERHRQRSTSAHNTIVIDNENSSEVWSGFRVARRAFPFDVEVTKNKDIIVTGSHDGYLRLKNHNIHKRKWRFNDNSIEVCDYISGLFSKAEAFFYFHPDLRVKNDDLDKGEIRLILNHNKEIIISVDGASSLYLKETLWHPAFGVSVPNQCLVANLQTNKLITKINWG